MIQDVDLHVRHGAFLPHWTKEGAIYHVRVRLADSLPQQKLQDWKEEREEIVRNAARERRKLTRAEQQRIDFLFSRKVEQYLDAGYGACWLQQDPIAQIVANALWHFNEERYKLFAWCIMPNHIHVILQPINDELHRILRSWKSFTAKEANKILKKTGSFWQREYFDHLIRNHEGLERAVEYVWRNPEEAGLKDWKWRWRIS